ncbi:MAG: adenosylcobinamide-GDP ribazoletransferase [Candidatus Bathyarchaeota archaeon]|nr:adenosylcobinamide-GDP ribazoletransferase [Candidatus Bathyarchaeum tardum]WGM89982.1 MAG: adenosylcobinamide-GDP ribazoletransferase [Candidatus Bathyarchaeum tardum]
MIIKGLKGLFGFLTILPIGMESMEALSKYFFLAPIVGLVLGAIAGGFGYLANMFLPQMICGFFVLVILELLTGFHHMDGLLDFSDAAMARGDTKKRLEIMHDMFTGAAAVTSGVIVVILAGLSFGSFSGLNILKVAIVAETLAKESMVLMAYLGKKPDYKGSGYYVVEAMENKHAKALASVFLCSVVGFVLVGIWFAVVIAAMGISVGVLTTFSNKTLESVTGDVMGATHEITRVVVLIMLLAVML